MDWERMAAGAPIECRECGGFDGDHDPDCPYGDEFEDYEPEEDERVMTMAGRDVTEMVGGLLRDTMRFEYQTKRDERLFEKAYFADFRSARQRDLRLHRDQFKARLEALNPIQED